MGMIEEVFGCGSGARKGLGEWWWGLWIDDNVVFKMTQFDPSLRVVA